MLSIFSNNGGKIRFCSIANLCRLLLPSAIVMAISMLNLGITKAIAAAPTATDIRIGSHADKTRFVIDISDDVKFKVFTLSDPYRVVIDALARDGGVGPEFYIDSMKYMSAWAADTGVKQFILHGSVGAGLSRAIYPEDRWEFMAATITAKDLAERHLMESGTPYTIIRNLNLLPIEVPESGKTYLTEDQLLGGPVTRDGLARLNMECMDNDACINEIFHGIDPDVVDPRRRN